MRWMRSMPLRSAPSRSSAAGGPHEIAMDAEGARVSSPDPPTRHCRPSTRTEFPLFEADEPPEALPEVGHLSTARRFAERRCRTSRGRSSSISLRSRSRLKAMAGPSGSSPSVPTSITGAGRVPARPRGAGNPGRHREGSATSPIAGRALRRWQARRRSRGDRRAASMPSAGRAGTERHDRHQLARRLRGRR